MKNNIKILIISILMVVCAACVFATKAPEETENYQQTASQSNVADTISFCSTLTDRPEQILHRYAYTVSYNKDKKIPNWVAWKLTKKHTNGQLKRNSSNAFREDTEVASPRATLNDYKKSGWSRGHMYPAGDAKWSKQAMYESFLLTNICPQNMDLNGGSWEKIESLSRQWAKKFGEIYIVCGPVLGKNHKSIGKNNVAVPDAFFKVILCMTPEPKAIGFICENTSTKLKTEKYVRTVDEIEQITGIDFFPFLDDNIENEIEAQSNLKIWLRK